MAKPKAKPKAAAKAKKGKKTRPQIDRVAAPQPPAALPTLVAVGASAGGLDAFNELLVALPADLGMALVLIQHQQPDRLSMLARLLQKSTVMPVVEIVDETVPRANHVYVMPGGRTVRLEAGRLRVRARPEGEERHHPIDEFMRSLADTPGQDAIGVVLSGTASDGTDGLLAIKSAGGVCFAQDDASAEHNSMPRSAIASGCVDFVLPPAKIARELARIVHHPAFRPAAERGPIPAPAAGDDRHFRTVLEMLRQHSGVVFSQYRSSSIGRRVARRMALHSIESLADYVNYLRAHHNEVALLYEDLLIPATRFFRDPEVFEFLKKQVLQRLAQERQGANKPLRLWSVGCSSGEEAYTLAMIGIEALATAGGGGGLQVFGTDLNPSALRRARAGRYSADIAADVSPARLQRFFTAADHGYRVAKSLRDVCIFAQHDVAREAPFSRLDVVCCRNVMIYMEPSLQRRIFPVLHYALNPGSTLVLGSAESATAASTMFKPMGRGAQRKYKVYTNLAGAQPHHFEMTAAPGPDPAQPVRAGRAFSAGDEARREADRIVLDQYAPAGVVVDANLDIIEFRGRTSPYLEPSPGAASLSLMRLARGNLGAYIRSGVANAQKSQAPVKMSGLPLPDGDHRGQAGEMSLHVLPLRSPRDGDRATRERTQFLVLFRPESAAHPAPPKPPGARGKGRDLHPDGETPAQEIERLQRQLAESQELIYTLSEEYQAAQQEHQAAAEEVASANEELQSTNEELETSKEELQSANEEISTVNDELRHRNNELHQTNADLQNLITITNFAVLLLDRELRIRRFSPAAERFFNLLPSDVGRRISDIRTSVGSGDVEPLVLAALASGSPQQREFNDRNGRWYELFVNLYINPENQVDGVVLVILENERLRQLGQQLGEAFLDAAANPMAVIADDGALQRANQAYRRAAPQWEQATPPATVPDDKPLAWTLTAAGKPQTAWLRRLPGKQGLLLSWDA